MKTRFIILLVSLLGLALLALGILLWQAVPVRAQSAGILYVAPGGACSGRPNCYASVQPAVDAAASGDEIRVAAGTYTEISARPRNDITTTGIVTQVLYISKTVTVRGGYNTDFSVWDPAVNVTTLNAQNQGRVIYITGDSNISPTIEGLSITGGDATGLTGYDYYGEHDVGGGVYVMTATATLNNNQIFSNTAPYGGGGVYLGFSTGQLSGNTISNNNINTGGGGVFLYEGTATLTDNQIISNASQNLGGGLYLFSTAATLKGNTIADNTATVLGGGVDVASCSPTFSSNVISGNTAPRGGGLYLWYSHSILTNNVIVDNQVTTEGAGLLIAASQPKLLHTTVARNIGGDGSGVFVTGNGSGTNSTVTMTNTVVVNHQVGVTVDAGSAVAVDGVLWFGNGTNSGGAGTTTVTHANTGDPAFASDGYHLTVNSAAIDKGLNIGVTTDIDGQPRFGVPDLGADEYWPPGFPKYIYLPLVTRSQ